MTKLKHNGILQLTALIFAVFFANSAALAESVPPFVSVSSNSSIHFSSAVTLELQKPDDALQLECPADISTYTDINECTADISNSLNVNIISGTIAGLTWEMTGATKGTSQSTGINQIERYIFNEGVTFIRYTARDNAGNVAECQFTVTVTDNEAPIISAPKNLTIKCDGRIPSAHTTLQAFLNAGGFASDNCNLLVSSFALISEVKDNRNCPYTLTRTYQISDEYGNVGSVKQHIFVLDEEGLISQMAISNSGATATISYTKSDVSCRNDNNGFIHLTINGTTGNLTYAWSSNNGNGIVQGEKDQNSLTDGDYNVKVYEDGVYLLELNVGIWVADNETPVITCPADIILECGRNVPAAFTTLSQFETAGGKASDNCQLNYASFRMLSETKNRQICPYILTRTYQISDINGNIGKAEQFIFVNEGTEPEPQQPLILKSGMAGTITAKAIGNWSDSNTWDLGRIPLPDDDVVIPSSYIVALNVDSECNNIEIQNGGTLTSGVYTLKVNGNWTNNGTYTSGTGTVEFKGGTNNNLISGSQPSAFFNLNINKGTSNSTIIEVNGTGTISNTGTLSIMNGLFKMTTGTFQFKGNSLVTIPTSGGIWINGATLNSISTSINGFSIQNDGLIKVSSGTLNIGTAAGNSSVTRSDGTLEVTGGTLNVAGRLEVSGGTANISGGTINLNTVGHNSSTVGSLDLSLSSDFTMSAGVINFLNPNGTGSFDVIILNGSGGTKSFAGGSFNFGDGTTETYRMSSQVPFPAYTKTSNTNLSLSIPVAENGTYSFPLTDATGNSIPATITITGDSYTLAAYVEIKTFDSKHPNNANTINKLNRYWEVTTNGITNPVYNITAAYHSNDVFGNISGFIVGNRIGAAWNKSNNATVGSGTISLNGISQGSFVFTALDSPTISINNSNPSEICSGSPITLNTTATGDPIFSYAWTFADNTNVTGESTGSAASITQTLSNTSGAAQTVVYTVEVTDGNGFTANASQLITVNPLPVVLTSSTSVCVGSTITLSPSSSGTWVSSDPAVASVIGSTITGVSAGSATFTFTETATGCSSITSPVTVKPLPVVLAPASFVCVGSNITLSPTTGGTWSSSNPALSTVNNAGLVTGVAAGDVTFTFTETATDCSATTGIINVIAPTVPTVSITANPGNTICQNTNVTFTTLVGNAGTNPTYQWQINGTDVTGANNSTFSSTILNNADKVAVIVTSDAPCPASKTSNIITMTVNPPVTPSVSILESANPICAGSTVNFSSVVGNGGTVPTYQWQVNESDVPGAIASTYSSSSLVNGDRVRVNVNSNATCAINNPATSNVVTMTVNPVLVPSITISASQTTICPGETVTFAATPTNGGTNPAYQWKVNGVNVGSNLPTYSTSGLTNGDIVNITLTSNATCASPTQVTSNDINMTVNPGTPTIPGAITGKAVVCPTTSETYTVAAVPNATSYNWTVPTGWSITAGSGTESITVTTGVTGQNGNIGVTASNSCGTSTARTMAVIVGSLSVAPTIVNITNNSTCFGTTKTLTVADGSLGTGANWEWFTGSCGGTLVGTGVSITVNPAAGTSTTYYVRATGACNVTTCAEGTVIVSPAAPSQSGAITGTTPVCPGVTEIYSIAAVTNATSYNWVVPTGWTITAGQGTTSVTVTSGATGQNGNISVTAINSCGTSASQTFAVKVGPGTPAIPGSITGSSEQCINSSGKVYSIVAVPNATSYTWTVPAGWTITAGQGSTSVTVSTNGVASSGNISVTASNSCGTGSESILPVAVVTGVPNTPGPITGLTAICPVKSVTYSISAVTGAVDYTWIVPASWSITAGQGTTSITAQVPIAALGGNVTVRANNVCGSSPFRTQAVTVSNTATVYAGLDQVVCFGTAQVQLNGDTDGAIDKKNEWDWVAVSGGTFSDGDALNTYYNFPNGSATTGILTVRIESNINSVGCNRTTDEMTITILPLPTASISGATSVCNGTGTDITFTATPNTTVTYTVNGGANQTISVGATGTATFSTGALTANATYTLVNVFYTTSPSCTQTATGSALVTVNPVATANAGTDQTICADGSATLDGSVGGAAVSGTWSGGTGTFNPDANSLTAVYNPSVSEIAYGSVTLTLTTNDPAGPCEAVSDQIIIQIDPVATVNAGTDQTICANSSVTLAGIIGGVATSGTWSGGTGFFSPDANSLTAVYTPSAAEITTGTVTLTLTTNDPAGPCNAATDQVIITINPQATANAGTDQAICANSTVTLSGSVGNGATTGSWSGGNGTFNPDNTTLGAVYTPSAGEISDGLVTLTLTTDDPAGPCGAVSDQVQIVINPLATVNAGIDQTICEGSFIILAGTIGGAASSVTWSGGTGTFSPNNTTINATYNPGTGETGPVTLTLTTNDPAGLCTAVSDEVIITVNPIPTVTAGPDQMICSNATATVIGTFGGGAVSAFWSTNGSGTFDDINSPTAVYTPGNGDIFNEVVTLTYQTDDPPGICGPATATVTITVKKIITITSQPQNTGVCATYPADLIITADGDNLEYQWYKGIAPTGTPVINTSNISGAQSSILHFNNATSADAGSYYVVISSANACASETSNVATLNVDEEITITSQFASNSACIGDDVTYTIVAEPGGSLTYQWRKDGLDIPGETTNSLTLSNIDLTDAGSYDVFIQGLSGYTCSDAQSAPATLSIIEDATINPATLTQDECINTSITDITYVIGGGGTGATISAGALPPGVTGVYNSGVFTISGTPTSTGTYNFTVTTTGPCAQASTTGTINVNQNPTLSVIPLTQTICPGASFADIVISNPNNIPGTTYSWTRDNTAILTGMPNNGTDIPVATPITGNLISSDPQNSQTTIFTITATSPDGCVSAPFTVSITVVDNTPPVKPTLSTITSPCAVTLIPPTTTDNCDGTVTGTTTSPLIITGPGQTIVTWTFTDAAGNFVTANQVVNVNDVVAPVWNNPAFFPAIVNRQCHEDTSPASTGTPTATDNCSPVTVTYTDVISPGGCIGQYTIKRNWVAADTLGNSRPGVQTIYVSDNVKPVLVCRDTTVANADEVWDPWELHGIFFSDNCGIDTVFLMDEWFDVNEGSTSGFCPTEVYRRYVVYDKCGNVSEQCTQNITVASNEGCSVCQEVVPKFFVNMNNAPDSTYVLDEKNLTREGACCITEDPNGAWGCISFDVYLDEDAVGLYMTVEKPGPQGSEYYKIDCADSTKLGDVICLTGGRWYTLTFCKPGEDKPIYVIQSISGAITPDSLTTRADVECFGQLHVTGLDPATMNWRVKYPAGANYLLQYLDTTDIANPTFYPDSITPALIIYEVCGTLLGYPECDGDPITDCAEVIVSTLPAININLDVDLEAICKDSIPLITAQLPNEDPSLTYTFQWYKGPDGTGNPVSTSRNFQPDTIGTYSVRVTEITSGIPCNQDITNFNIYYDLEGPILLVPPDTLIIDCAHPNPESTITAWVGSARAYEQEDTTISVEVFDDYVPFIPHCNLVKTIHFWSYDQCDNMTLDSAMILIIDTVPPTIICPRDTSNFAEHDSCLIRDFALLPPIIDDACDPNDVTLFWEKTGATSGSGTGTVTGPFNVGVTRVLYTAIDLCGNIDTCSQNITIRDVQAPNIIVCPGDETVSAPPPGCEMEVLSIDSIVAFDNCTGLALDLFWIKTNELGDTIATGPGYVNGTLFPAGVTHVRYIVTDLYGNADSSCTFTVTVNDTVPPTIIDCPHDISANVDDSCELYVVVPSPTYTDPCGEVVDVRHDSPFTGANDSIATGIYPVGIHYITWTFTDKWGNDTTCIQTVEIKDIQPPVLICPPDISANTVFGEEYAINIPISEPSHNDNCDYILYWGMVDSTGVMIDTSYQLQPINVLTSYDTLYVGVYTVTYSLIDFAGDTIDCSFNITIEAAPIIDCAPDTIVWAADSVCTNTFDPGIPQLLVGSAPIDWTWEMTGVTTGSGSTNDANVLPDFIGDVAFNLGTTTIRWTATNTSGTDTCYQYIEVRDTIRPLITKLDSLEGCVESIQFAIYNVNEDDLYVPDRPDYMLFNAGDTTLNLEIIQREDNCNLTACPDSITWRIDFTDVQDQNPPYNYIHKDPITGSGQLSDYPDDIEFPGDGTYTQNVDHTITYWITDCSGNTSLAQTRTITVTPRPKIVKMN